MRALVDEGAGSRGRPDEAGVRGLDSRGCDDGYVCVADV